MEITQEHLVVGPRDAHLDNFTFNTGCLLSLFIFSEEKQQQFDNYKRFQERGQQTFILLSHNNFIADPIGCVQHIKREYNLSDDDLAIGIFQAAELNLKANLVNRFQECILALKQFIPDGNENSGNGGFTFYIEMDNNEIVKEYVRMLFPQLEHPIDYVNSDFYSDDWVRGFYLHEDEGIDIDYDDMIC